MLVIVEPVRHIDDDRLGRADVFPSMVEVGWNDEESRVLFADDELVQLPERRRILASIEDHEFHQSGNDEETIRPQWVEAPGTDTAREGGRDMYLDDGLAHELPARARHFGHVTVFM